MVVGRVAGLGVASSLFGLVAKLVVFLSFGFDSGAVCELIFNVLICRQWEGSD